MMFNMKSNWVKMESMKYLMALFVVSLFLQPVELQACAMDTEEPQGHHAAMDGPHDTDCCEPQSDDRMDQCGMIMPCSFVSVSVPVIPVNSDIMLVHPVRQFDGLTGDHYTEPPSAPLFRPPIV